MYRYFYRLAAMLAAIILVAPFAASTKSGAASLEKGKAINKSCALCHGVWGQGTSGAKSPRLAGVAAGFLTKVLKEYRSGKRINGGMVATVGLKQMSDDDIESVAAYLAAIDLRGDKRFLVDNSKGDVKRGRKMYMSECKSCHRANGYGKFRKGIPALAGQQTVYIERTINRFKARTKVHDDDPEDDIFDELIKTDKDMKDLLAFISTLDDANETRIATLPGGAPIKMAVKKKIELASNQLPGAAISHISQTIARMKLNDGVSRESAIKAMRSMAKKLNMRFVGEQSISSAAQNGAEKNGAGKSPALSIFQFYNHDAASNMISSNPLYAAYMPFRVAMVDDNKGQTWLMMLNLDMLVDNSAAPKQISETVISLNQKMLEIMVAGIKGKA